jgi:predicted choloylglycine hydrolase
MPTEYLVALSSNYTGSDSASAQKVFNVPADGAVAVLANTTYFVEGLYMIAPSAGLNFNAESVQTLFALGSGATLTSIRYVADTTAGLSSAVTALKRVQAAAATAITVTDAAPGGAATNFVIQIRGIIRTNAAGTITPQFQFTGTPGADPVVQANSFFRLVPVGSGSVTTIGAWT